MLGPRVGDGADKRDNAAVTRERCAQGITIDSLSSYQFRDWALRSYQFHETGNFTKLVKFSTQSENRVFKLVN